MPGRRGYSSSTGWNPGSPGSTLPQNPSYNGRSGNTPLEYKATKSIEFIPGFESGEGDSFEAYITQGGSGGEGSELASSGIYRYGFNGKENDDEVKGEGNQQDYGMRIYDPRLGRFLSVDPLQKEYPELATYQFASNTPIQAIDLDGLEMYNVYLKTYQDSKGVTRFQIDHQEEADNFWDAIGVAIRNGPNAKSTVSFNYIYNGQEIDILDPTKEKVLNFWRNVNPANFEDIAKAEAWDKIKGVIIGGALDAATGAAEQYVNNKITTPKEAPAKQSQVTVQTERANGGKAPNGKNTLAERRAAQLAINKQSSLASESMVESNLMKTLKPNEILIKKPRIYIGDGKNKKDYAVPDFAVYNTKTNQIVRIPDAKDGGGKLTGQQKKLNEQNGVFNGSSRYRQTKAGKVEKGLVVEEKTNVTQNK